MVDELLTGGIVTSPQQLSHRKSSGVAEANRTFEATVTEKIR